MTNKKTTRLLFLFFLLVFFVCFVVFLFKLMHNKAVSHFSITYDNSGIEEFLDNLSKRIEAEKFDIINIQNSSNGIQAQISIKPKGKVAQTVYILFHNQDNKDIVSSISINYFSHRVTNDSSITSDYAYNCNTLVAEVLEKYITGNTFVREKIPSYLVFLQKSSQSDTDTPDPCFYSLNKGASVSISYTNNSAYLLIYKIEIKNNN